MIWQVEDIRQTLCVLAEPNLRLYVWKIKILDIHIEWKAVAEKRSWGSEMVFMLPEHDSKT